MNITSKFITAVAAVLVLSTPSFAQEAPTKETVVATVNGTDITLGHMLALANRLPDQYLGVENKNLYDGIIDQLIQQQLLSDLIKEQTAELKLAAENEHRALYASEAIAGIYANALTQEAINERYTALYESAEPVLEYNSSHILVESEEEAKAIVEALTKGADFATLAKEKSTGPTGANGGNLGWTGQGSFVPEFEAAMLEMKVEGVSAPVKTQFGWHVIKLNETRNKPAPDLATVQNEIEEGLRAEALEKRISQLEGLANVVRSKQEIDPSFIKKFHLLKD